jgi:hypothetical protein
MTSYQLRYVIEINQVFESTYEANSLEEARALFMEEIDQGMNPDEDIITDSWYEDVETGDRVEE